MVLELLKKSVNIGLGVVALGQEKIRERQKKVKGFIDGLAKRGETTPGIVPTLIRGTLAQAGKGVEALLGLPAKVKPVVKKAVEPKK